MKHLFFTLIFLAAAFLGKAQKLESFHINLYTDSLKKGTHNYINVDGKMSDGSWRPLTNRELEFKSDYGCFEGNSLVLPDNPSVTKVNVTVWLKGDASNCKKITIWIKQKSDPPLPAYDKNAEVRSSKKKG